MAIPSQTNQISDGYESLVSANDNGEQELSVIVGGVHCAGCIQKIESSLKEKANITNARLNFSTGKLNISWSGEKDLANQYVCLIEKLGYKVSPYNPDIEKTTAENENRFLLMCLGIAGFAMGNIMLFSVGLWSTDTDVMGFATREFMHWISALIAVPAIAFSGRPFFSSAYQALKNGHANMDVPISLALILACVMSFSEMLRGGEHVYFDSAVMLMFFLLIGRYLDFRARRNARSAATDLLQTLSGFAQVIEGEQTKRVLIRDLSAGMRVLVSVGEKVPVDGTVIEGESTIDAALITGETLPEKISVKDKVYGGTINLSSPIIIEVDKAAEDSVLADIVRLMEKAEQGQAKYVRLADRAAKLYTPVVHTLAAVAFILWWGVFGAVWQDALLVAITVLIITCPCALGLAVPVVQVLASGILTKKGILIKSGDALERLASIDTAIFDKTGTLTIGKPVLQDGSYSEDDLQLAASLASHSRHPLSQALVESYKGKLLPLKNVEEISGKGIQAIYKDNIVQLGSRDFCGQKDAPHSSASEIWLKYNYGESSVFYMQDQLRDNSVETIKHFQNDHVSSLLLSGDRQEVVSEVARNLEIKVAKGGLTPVEKYEEMEVLKKQGHKILMVGDGLNDAPVLAGADVSMAPGTAIDMAQNAADIVFMGDKLCPTYEAYNIAKKSQSLVKQNFTLAVLYNLIAIPLAFAGMVTPMIAALAMSGSSLLVIANSFRLKLMS